METVKDNQELLELLTSRGFEFMSNYFMINSEDSMKSFRFVEAFLDLNLPKEMKSELNEEQVLYSINSSVLLIRGAVNILLFKN